MSDDSARLRTAPDFVAMYARIQPGRLACADLASGRRWTYAELHVETQRCVSVLQGDHGLAAGDRVAVLAKNSGELVVLQNACMRLGLIFVPLNWRLAVAELSVLIEDCAPKVLVHDDIHAAAASELDAPCLSVKGLAAAIGKAQPAPAAPLPAADLPSVLLYTSGTSGKPKAVIITETGMFHSATNFGIQDRVDYRSAFLCESPLFHVIGLIACVRVPLLHGGTILMSDGFEPGRTIARIADPALAITHYFCVPQMATQLRHHPDFAAEKFHRLVALVTGGAPNPESNIRWWLDHGITMVNGFGMTETGSTFSMSLEHDVIRSKGDSVGLPAPTVLVRLADDDGREVGPGVTGELWLKGPNVTPGYWNRPEETAKAFTADGWFKTGDLARQDEDGFLWIVDRKKDMYISGGENVFPVEVEAVLLDHPAVKEASVVGVPDDRWGEVGCAYLVARSGQTADGAALAAFCNERLARYKIPKHFVWVDALPRTGSGKVQKNVLRARKLN